MVACGEPLQNAVDLLGFGRQHKARQNLSENTRPQERDRGRIHAMAHRRRARLSAWSERRPKRRPERRPERCGMCALLLPERMVNRHTAKVVGAHVLVQHGLVKLAPEKKRKPLHRPAR